MDIQTPLEDTTTISAKEVAPLQRTSYKKIAIVVSVSLFILVLSFILFYTYKKETSLSMQNSQKNTTGTSNSSTTASTSITNNNERVGTNSLALTLPDLSHINNIEAKKLIEDYYTTIKPNHDELAKQIPGGIVTYKGNTPNVSPGLAEKWRVDGDKIWTVFNKLETLNAHTMQVALTLNSWNSDIKVYVNNVLVMEDTADDTSSKMSIKQLMGSDDFRKYLGLKGQENIFVLKKGSNTVKITYTLQSIVKERNVGVVSVMNISPVSLIIQRMEKLTTGAFPGMFETKDEILKLEEKPTRIENGDPKKASGELVGTFIVQ